MSARSPSRGAHARVGISVGDVERQVQTVTGMGIAGVVASAAVAVVAASLVGVWGSRFASFSAARQLTTQATASAYVDTRAGVVMLYMLLGAFVMQAVGMAALSVKWFRREVFEPNPQLWTAVYGAIGQATVGLAAASLAYATTKLGPFNDLYMAGGAGGPLANNALPFAAFVAVSAFEAVARSYFLKMLREKF